MNSDRIHPDVLVIGAGPAGLSTAIPLARQGLDVLVVERHAGTSPFPKSTGVSTRTMEVFRSWGVDEQIRAGAMPIRPFLAVSATLAGPRLAVVPFGYPSAEVALSVSPTAPACCPQDHLEPVLLRHLLDRGGRVLFGTELVDFAMDATGVTARLRDRVTGHDKVVRAGYLVGADGPRSGVRKALGIPVEDLGTIGDFVAVTFRADLTRRFTHDPGALNAVTVDGSEALFVPTSTDDRWIFAQEWHPEQGQSIEEWTPQRCAELIRAGSGWPDLEPQLLDVQPFVMGGHVAAAFGAGRAYLVGDAAHRTTPVGGTGMNTAIAAGHNLGWKLAWVLRGWAAPALLDSYEAERRPVGASNVLRSLRRGPEPSADGLAEDLGVRYTPHGRAEGAEEHPTVGERAPHVWINTGGRQASTLDLFDGRLTLLTGRRGQRWCRAADNLAGSGPPIVALRAGRDVTDAGRTLADRYGLGASGAVLVRPDGYLAWRAATAPADVRGALQRAVAASLGWDGAWAATG